MRFSIAGKLSFILSAPGILLRISRIDHFSSTTSRSSGNSSATGYRGKLESNRITHLFPCDENPDELHGHLSLPFEVLHFALMLLRRFLCIEGAEVATLTGLWIL